MTGLSLLLPGLLLGLLTSDLLLLLRPAPRRRLGFLLVERDGTGAKARDVDEIGGSDPESDSEPEDHREARVALPLLDLAQESLGSWATCRPLQREARQVPSCPDVPADELQESVGVHPRELAILPGASLEHSCVPYFLVDQSSGWRCTWSRMGGLCS